MADKKKKKINKTLSDKIKIKAKISKIKIETPKGRPLLKWVGKAPLDYVEGHPTQLIEYYSPDKKQKVLKVPEYTALEKNWHNLLFHGDNKEVLATLLELGFRGKVNLIYIDPPFASNKDYMRKVELRGLKDLGKIEEGSESIIQQTMYEDIWKRDEYFQFMYERLILLKELLAETGSIYVHLDYRMVHYLKVLMDEVFGEENFRNEVVWCYTGPSRQTKDFPDKHDVILRYSKSGEYIFNTEAIRVPYKKSTLATGKTTLTGRADDKRLKELDERGKLPEDWWVDVATIGYVHSEITGFATQKPIALLERVIKASSNPNDLVLDCFIGSGTTAVATQKLGRRWIGVDINKGAIQLTSKRIQKTIKDQGKNEKYPTFAIYKVNNYDLKILHTEAKELAIQQYGITSTKTDPFFDGIRDTNELVKIIDFNHPLTLLDLQLIVDELNKRPDEDRNVIVICLGRETKVDAWIEEWNKKQPYKDTRTKQRIKQFIVFDLKDKNFVSYEPSKAEVEIERKDENKVKIKIKSFISPTIIKRLELEPGLLRKKIPDFRSMIDVVLIDTDHGGEAFRIAYSDVPEKNNELVKGKYELEIPKKKTKVAVKIIDMLGEEVLVTKEV
ncbi:MAG TPA: site-specific DNA-methyltransferase [Candidatus Bathyarchaeia archaeon]|nr:site-specific DNA-methyltransferase [Candidatus Bathyarchaeia archaeon]